MNVAKDSSCLCVRWPSRSLASAVRAWAAKQVLPHVAQAPSEGQSDRRPWASKRLGGSKVKLANASAKADLLKRVRRLEGQARGIAKMIEGDRDCGEILQQLAAIRSAAHQATVMLVKAYAAECMVSESSPEEIADALAVALSRLA
jgi:DNA-binding FrmR family transcriptional regulator